MEKKTGLSIANMLSVIGLIGLGLGTAMGIVLEGKEVAIAIGCGAGVFILGILGLFLAVKAKKAESEFGKWRKYEYLGLALCIGVIAFSAQPCMYSANFIISNRSLREAGDSDIATVRGMITRFKAQEADRLNLTREGLDNYLSFNPSVVSSSLQSFIIYEVMHGSPGIFNRHVLNEYVAEKSYLIEHGNFNEDLFGKYNHELDMISSRLTNFDFADFPSMATALTALSDSVGAHLTALSYNFNFGNIGLNDRGIYDYEPTAGYEYTERATTFGAKYAAMFTPGLGAIGLFAAFALLYILDYFLEFRSLRVPVKQGPKISDNDGLPL